MQFIYRGYVFLSIAYSAMREYKYIYLYNTCCVYSHTHVFSSTLLPILNARSTRVGFVIYVVDVAVAFCIYDLLLHACKGIEYHRYIERILIIDGEYDDYIIHFWHFFTNFSCSTGISILIIHSLMILVLRLAFDGSSGKCKMYGCHCRFESFFNLCNF